MDDILRNFVCQFIEKRNTIHTSTQNSVRMPHNSETYKNKAAESLLSSEDRKVKINAVSVQLKKGTLNQNKRKSPKEQSKSQDLGQ